MIKHLLLLILFGCSSTPRSEADAIRSVILDHLPEIRTCLTDEFSKSENGTSLISFFINPDGSVVAVKLEPKLNPETLNTCVITKFSQMKFPKPINNQQVEVRQPLNFVAPKPN